MRTILVEEDTVTIDGSTAKIRPHVLLDRLVNSGTKKIDVLPPHVIWVSPKRETIVVQRPPEYRNITLREDKTPECYCCTEDDECAICTGDFNDVIENHFGLDDGWSTYRLPVPWVTYVFHVEISMLHLVEVFANSHRLKSPKDSLGFLPLPNLYVNGGMCVGSVDMRATRNNSTISDASGHLIELFWGSAFNTDIQNQYESEAFEMLEAQTGSEAPGPYEVWEKMSFDEVLDIPWEFDAGCTLQECITEALYREASYDLANIPNGMPTNKLYSEIRQHCLLSRF